MKFLFLIDTFIHFAGTEKHLHQLSTSLVRRGHSCKVIVFESVPPAMIHAFDNTGVSIYVLDAVKIYSIDSLSKLFCLISHIKAFKPDIVQTFHFKMDTFGALAARLAGISCIISSKRDMGHLKTLRQLYLQKFTNRLIDWFIAVCDNVAYEISRTERIPLVKFKTIYNGLDISLYENGEDAKRKAREMLNIEQNAFVVGIVCIIRPEKNVGLFLESINKIKSQIKELMAIVVGDTEPGKEQLKNNLVRYCQENGIGERVAFVGYVRDIRQYVQAMDVVCLTPRENEGLSNAILEEMALGRPVVATNVGGNAELVVDGTTGFITPSENSDVLAKRLKTLYQNEPLRKSMEVAGRKRVEDHFAIDKMVQEHETFYYKCLYEGICQTRS